MSRARHKSGDGPEWRAWYKGAVWKAIRRHRLAEEPHCRDCAGEGKTVEAADVGHVESHDGVWHLFVRYENTKSLCRRHYKAHKSQLLKDAEGLPSGRSAPAERPYYGGDLF